MSWEKAMESCIGNGGNPVAAFPEDAETGENDIWTGNYSSSKRAYSMPDQNGLQFIMY